MLTKLKKAASILLGLYLFLLPWQTVFIFDQKILNGDKWHYGSGLIFATEMLLWLIAILQLVVFLKRSPVADRTKPINRHKILVTVSLWLLIIWSGLSLIWAPEKDAGFYNWFFLLQAAVLFFIILTGSINKKRIYLSLSLAGALQALLALWQFISQEIVANKWLGLSTHLPWQNSDIVIESSGRWLRAYGAFTHPNILGGFLVICFFATIIPAFKIDGRKNTPRRIIAALLILMGIFFSFSRSAWLALALGMIFIFVREIVNSKKTTAYYRNLTKYFLAPLVLAGVLFFLYQPLVLTRVSSADRLEANSINERLAYLSQAEEIIQNRWLAGTGIGNYTYVLYQADPAWPAWNYQPVHNIFVLIFAELGIVGIIVFAFFLISLLINSLFAQSNVNKIKFPTELAFFIAVVAIGCFDHYLWTSYVGLIMLFLSFSLLLKNDYE